MSQNLDQSQELNEMLSEVKLDDIVHVDYNQDALKQNFTAIVNYLSKLKRDIKKNEKGQNDNSERISELERINNDLRKEVQDQKNSNDDLKDAIEKLKDRADKTESEQQAMKYENERNKERILFNERDIADLKKQMSEMSDKMNNLEQQVKDGAGAQGNNGGEGSNGLTGEDWDKLRETFVTKEVYDAQVEEILDEIAKLKKQLGALDTNKLEQLLRQLENGELGGNNNNNNNNNNNSDDQAKNDARFEQIEAELQNLRELVKKRVDTERFEREINSLKSLINQLSSLGEGKDVQIVSGFGEEEKKYLDRLGETMENLEEEVRRLRSDVDNNRADYNKNKQVTDQRLDALENAMKFRASNDSSDELRNLINQLQEDLRNTSNLAEENERNIKNLKRSIQNNNVNNNEDRQESHGVGGDGISEELVDEKIRKCKEELLDLLKALKDEKVSFDDLWKSESVILEKLDEVAGALIKKLADKADTKKALIYIEKKINQLYQMVTKGGNQQEGDGLIVKRPMLWSCISCDKSLDKFGGKMGDYKNWAVFPPKETTPDRMGRFGKGYKSLLEKSRIKEERFRMENSRISQETLPQLHKTAGNGFGTSGQGYNKQSPPQQQQSEDI